MFWSIVSSNVLGLSDVSVKRCIAISDNENVQYYLFCLCNASSYAYAASVYLLQRTEARKSKSYLVFSKTRLAPLEKMTIPRLELMAVVIGVRCLQCVKQQLKISVEGTYLYTDSQCVLKWVHTDKDLSIFVKNRVQEIKKHDEIVFGYVSTKENPADIATKGTAVHKHVDNYL